MRTAASTRGRWARALHALPARPPAHTPPSQFLEDLQHGKGRFIGADKSDYDGEWRGGLRHGNGVQTFPSGDPPPPAPATLAAG